MYRHEKTSRGVGLRRCSQRPCLVLNDGKYPSLWERASPPRVEDVQITIHVHAAKLACHNTGGKNVSFCEIKEREEEHLFITRSCTHVLLFLLIPDPASTSTPPFTGSGGRPPIPNWRVGIRSRFLPCKKAVFPHHCLLSACSWREQWATRACSAPR